MEIFFDDKWNKWVAKLKWVIIVLSLAWAGVAFYFASTFEAPDKESDFLVASNPL